MGNCEDLAADIRRFLLQEGCYDPSVEVDACEQNAPSLATITLTAKVIINGCGANPNGPGDHKPPELAEIRRNPPEVRTFSPRD